MSAEGFCQEIESEEMAREEGSRPEISHKSTVAERIPADTLAKLKALRDNPRL